MRWLVVFGLLLAGMPASAARDATETARREAQQFLVKCPADAPDKRQLCLADQSSFVWDYVSAKAGNYEDQISVAYFLAHGGGAYDLVESTRHNDTEACAWYLVAINSGDMRLHLGQVDVAKVVCGRLLDAEHLIAASRAARIAGDIRSHPTRALPGDTGDFYDRASKGLLTEDTFPLGSSASPLRPDRSGRRAP